MGTVIQAGTALPRDVVLGVEVDPAGNARPLLVGLDQAVKDEASGLVDTALQFGAVVVAGALGHRVHGVAPALEIDLRGDGVVCAVGLGLGGLCDHGAPLR